MYGRGCCCCCCCYSLYRRKQSVRHSAIDRLRFLPLAQRTAVKGAITSKIKHAIKLKTSPARLAQLLQPSLSFCFSLQLMTAYRDYRPNKMLMRAVTVLQVLQDLFYVYCMFYFTCDRSLMHERVLCLLINERSSVF